MLYNSHSRQVLKKSIRPNLVSTLGTGGAPSPNNEEPSHCVRLLGPLIMFENLKKKVRRYYYYCLGR